MEPLLTGTEAMEPPVVTLGNSSRPVAVNSTLFFVCKSVNVSVSVKAQITVSALTAKFKKKVNNKNVIKLIKR